MDKSVSNFLDAVGSARALLGMTLQDVADRCGTSKSNIHAIENKQQEPKLGLAIKLASTLHLSIDNY